MVFYSCYLFLCKFYLNAIGYTDFKTLPNLILLFFIPVSASSEIEYNTQYCIPGQVMFLILTVVLRKCSLN